MVPLMGKKYTWFTADGNSMSRIDQFLLSEGAITEWNVTDQWNVTK